MDPAYVKMNISVYIFNEYDSHALNVLQLLKKSDLTFELSTYKQGDLESAMSDIGEKVRRLPQVVIDGSRIGGYYDLLEFLINKKIINYKGNRNDTGQNGKGESRQKTTAI